MGPRTGCVARSMQSLRWETTEQAPVLYHCRRRRETLTAATCSHGAHVVQYPTTWPRGEHRVHHCLGSGLGVGVACHLLYIQFSTVSRVLCHHSCRLGENSSKLPADGFNARQHTATTQRRNDATNVVLGLCSLLILYVPYLLYLLYLLYSTVPKRPRRPFWRRGLGCLGGHPFPSRDACHFHLGVRSGRIRCVPCPCLMCSVVR